MLQSVHRRLYIRGFIFYGLFILMCPLRDKLFTSLILGSCSLSCLFDLMWLINHEVCSMTYTYEKYCWIPGGGKYMVLQELEVGEKSWLSLCWHWVTGTADCMFWTVVTQAKFLLNKSLTVYKVTHSSILLKASFNSSRQTVKFIEDADLLTDYITWHTLCNV